MYSGNSAIAATEHEHHHKHQKKGIFSDAQDLIALGNPLEEAEKSIGSQLSSINLIDQEGNPFAVKDYFDKPFVLSFIFLNCPEACSAMTNNVSQAIRLSGDSYGKDFRVLSVSFDIKNDKPEELKKFGLNFTKSFDNWIFSVGDEKSVAALVNDIGITIIKDDKGYINHVNMLTIVDTGGTIKKHIYGDAPDPKEIWKGLRELLDKSS